MNGSVVRWVGTPVTFEELRHRPGRRLTLRAGGPRGSVIVELYDSDVVATAARLAVLGDGPPEPEVPAVLAVNPDQRMVVLSDLSGIPLREALLAPDGAACSRAGAALASWHRAWHGKRPPGLHEHTVERELEALIDYAALAPREIGTRVAGPVAELREGWTPATVVHRALHEEHVLLGERVGLVDLDDAALGPPELDVGNLLAHVDLLELRSGRDLRAAEESLLAGYATHAELEPGLLERCRTLARLRLACLHAEPRLIVAAPAVAVARA